MDPVTGAALLAQGAGGLVLLFFGGEFLVRGASALALRLGVSPLAVGLTVVAFGTSAPELVVSLDAALAGADDISMGNVVGSNICNIALILGLCSLIRPARVQAKLIRLDVPIMVGVTLLLILLMLDGRLTRLGGAVLVAGILAYTGMTLVLARRETRQVQHEYEEGIAGGGASTPRSLALVAAGLLALVLGGNLLVESAIAFATVLGVSEAVIGLTVVALGTSLPELATSLVAAIRQQGDIAIGNIVGSNIFNILGILGITAVVNPLTIGGVTMVDLAVMLGLAVFLLPLLYTGLRLNRPEAAGLLVIYAGYIGWLILG